MTQVAIITGASTGLGAEFARQLDANCANPKYKYYVDEIWLVARNKDKLMEVASQLKHTAPKVIPTDLTQAAEIEGLLAQVDRNTNIKLLINNAGFGSFAPFTETRWQVYAEMIELNIMAANRLAHNLAKHMAAGGGIINLASSAGFQPSHGYTVYSATKAYMLHFSIGLRAQLKPQGINVLAVCPGPVKTEFFDRAGGGQGLVNSIATLTPDVVVRKAFKDLQRGSAISIPGVTIKLILTITKFMRRSWMAKVS